MTSSPQETSQDECAHVGEQLKQAREQQSLSLEEVVSQTRISLSNLRAIESSTYEKLPADSFTRGLIILYATFLGLDGRQLAEHFFLERDGETAPILTPLHKCRISHALEPKKLAEPTHISSAAIAAMLLALIVFSFSGFCWYFSWNPFSYLTDKVLSLSASAPPPFHPADPATIKGSPRNTLAVQAVFLVDSRVLISLDNQAPWEQQYAKGTTIQWEAERQMQIEFFHPESAELHVNGTPLPFPPTSTDGRYILRLPTVTNAP